MTLKPLDFDFPIMSDLSVRPPHAVPAEEMRAEIEQELADRRGFYRRLVAKQTMTQEDADRHIAIFEAIAADLAWHADEQDEGGTAHSWDAKVRELRREIALRRNRWPKRIASPSDPIDAAGATRRMERLEAVHFKYWIDLFRANDAFAAVPIADMADTIRAWLWIRDDWRRRAADAGDRAADPAWSTAAEAARLEAHLASLPAGQAAVTRSYAAGVEATRLRAAQRLGLAPKEGIAA